MAAYKLTVPARKDVAEIITYEHKYVGAWAANQIEDKVFAVFHDLVDRPEIGHKRTDLTNRNILFHYARPYFILFHRTAQTVQILRIVQESRDLRKFV